MQEIIQKVIATEAEAKQMVLAAKAEAERILTVATRRTQELKTTCRNEAQLAARDLLSRAAKEADIEKQARLAMLATELEKAVCLEAEVKEAVIQAALKCIRS